MDINLISIIAFYTILAVLIVHYRKKIIVQHKIFLLLKTKVGIKLIDKIARFKKFWKYWGYAGIPVGFVGMIGIVVLLLWSLAKIIQEPDTAAGVSLVLPGVHVPGASIFLPFWYGIIAIIILLTVHEGCHGIVARAHDIKVKSTGVGLLIALPLAFVEPDEKQLNRKPLATKLSVFAAGPFANICTGIIVLLISALFIAPALAGVTSANGVYVTEVLENMPAEIGGLNEGDIILSVNNMDTATTDEFVSAMEPVKPGDTVTFGTQRGEFNIVTTSNPTNASKAHMGISFKQNLDLKDDVKERFGRAPWIFFYLIQLCYWVFLLNIGVGLINLLPLGPVDGGQMIRAALLAKMRNKATALRVISYISMFALFLLLLNIIGPIF